MKFTSLFKWLSALFLFAFMLQAQAAVVTVFTDKASWISNVSTFETEDFSDATLNPGITVASTVGQVNIGMGVWEDTVDPFGRLTANTTFSFAPPLIGFGGNWDFTPSGGLTAGIRVTLTLLNEGQVVLSEAIDHAIVSGFWGITSDTRFTDILLEANHVSNPEAYFLDDMVYAQFSDTPDPINNPIPATVWLFATGLLGLIGLGRKSKRQVS